MLFKLNPELLSPEAIKSLVKGLRKGMKEEMGVDVPQHSAQEILARQLGYPNWHALKQREVQASAKPELPTAPVILPRHQQAIQDAFALAEEAKVKGVMIYVDEMNDETVLDLWVSDPKDAKRSVHRFDVAAGAVPNGEALAEKMEEWENTYFDLHKKNIPTFDRALKQGFLPLSERALWLTPGDVHDTWSEQDKTAPEELNSKERPLFDLANRRQRALAEAFDFAARATAVGIHLHVTSSRGSQEEMVLQLYRTDDLCDLITAQDVDEGAFWGPLNYKESAALAKDMRRWMIEYADLNKTGPEGLLDMLELSGRMWSKDRDKWMSKVTGEPALKNLASLEPKRRRFRR